MERRLGIAPEERTSTAEGDALAARATPRAPSPPALRAASPPALLAVGGRTLPLEGQPCPLELGRLVAGEGPWEMEIGFGKGRFLLERAAAMPKGRFLGIEVASRYFRLAARRSARRRLENLVVIRDEAAYLLATYLPGSFARAIHVYFPDPWPKPRHHKRRLFDPERIDLLLAQLVPGGALYFATDHLEYGEAVRELIAGHPLLRSRQHSGPWPDGPRTNYEAKYEREGRPIVRLEAHRCERDPRSLLHPAGAEGILVGPQGDAVVTPPAPV